MKHHPVLLSFILSCISHLAHGARPSTPLSAQGCALLMGNTIYCYGGAQFSSNNDDEDEKVPTTNAMYSLRLSDSGEQLDDWQEVTNHGRALGANAAFAVSPLPDGQGMIIVGGWGSNSGSQLNSNSQNIIYYANSGNWRSLYTYPQQSHLTSEMPAILDNNRTIWIWGGRIVGDDGVAEPENMGIVDRSQRMTTRQISFPSGSHGRTGHSAALGSDGHTIYYFGGLDGDSDSRELDDDHGGFKNVSMSEILVFDTNSQSWSKRTTSGSVVPSSRYFHTTTPIPGTNDILLYGGRRFGSRMPVDDFCYVYNTDSNEWTQINTPSMGAGPRWGHSAILHNDNRLFVLFGVNADGASTDDFYVFDYKNREWEGSSGGGTGGNGPSGGSGGGGSGGNKLSGGGIAGIVIAILVILGIIIAGFLLYRRRQRNAAMNQPTTWYGNTPPQGKDDLVLAPPPKDILPQYAMMDKGMVQQQQHPDAMLLYNNGGVATAAAGIPSSLHKPDEPATHDKIAVINKEETHQKPNE